MLYTFRLVYACTDGPRHRVEVRALQAVHGVHPTAVATSGSVQPRSDASLGALANHGDVPTLSSVATRQFGPS